MENRRKQSANFFFLEPGIYPFFKRDTKIMMWGKGLNIIYHFIILTISVCALYNWLYFCHIKINTCDKQTNGHAFFNPLPHMPILDSSSSAANKTMMSKIWKNWVQVFD